ncbi:MAG: hypothetical protein A3J48_03780 [Candidatus Doudnabacteria bacterium RIFCSPHIGHO2_02_FULL_46_11]|uniref:DUF8128 domain-containing protein n=1 Tax=Candidatus Doudnabacteria bacterium RIFCSPHIGHO2_02_FULL_46_11 TaxID=1817832 RepID=A0A1F5P490_9BACT|nr:MAG: hypothetical protein A3J48_03780 [Candidatus Doudnabacteria bacterium RIFCSPHIGHO2_02_FULL_46_11]
MNIFEGQFLADVMTQTFVGLSSDFEFALIHGAWAFFALYLFYAMFYIRFHHKNDEFLARAEWVFLRVSVPEMPSPSIMAAEQMFTQMHGTKKPIDWRQHWVLGEQRLNFSFEIVSLGGVIRYIIRTAREDVEAAKAAIYSQYPDAELAEVGDYMDAIKTPYGPDSSYDFWGCDFRLDKPDCYPIKVFENFEHRAAETILDPLAGLLEAMANIEPEEIITVQILAVPDDEDWKEAGLKEVERLKGIKGSAAENPDLERAPYSLMMHLSEKDKEVINGIQKKLSKLSFKAKVRVLYIAPRDKFRKKTRLSTIVGSIRQFSVADMNSLKQNLWTETLVPTRVAERFEGKHNAEVLLWKKRELIKNFKKRDLWGGRTYHLSTEELGSLFHFPLEDVRKTSIEKIEARKGEPPVNLPV